MRRLVVCCDGTWNKPDQLTGGGGPPDPHRAPAQDESTEKVKKLVEGVRAPTHVTKVALAISDSDADDHRQILHYEKGVGSRPGEHLLGGAFGVGLSRNIQSCYRFLVRNYEPGDELYFFGFSRGAFAARSLAGLVRNSGILRPEYEDRIGDAYDLYRSRGAGAHPRGIEAEIFRKMCSRTPHIKFIGVWDTVGALGIPLNGALLIPWINRRWTFHDTELSSYVDAAYQALAIDEHRGQFKPTLWKQDPKDAPHQVLEQVWFAGAHCDVGGGYRQSEVSEIPLLWMVDRARKHGLAFSSDHLQIAEGECDEADRLLGKCLSPNALGAIHESRARFYKVIPTYHRPLDDPKGSRQSVASSARRRFDAGAGYSPATLATHIARNGPITEVEM